jgi:sugar O-acyltransferase (sialic acid O-acetyltransferase NeuD family)
MKTGSVVIFGTGKFASLAWYCLTHDSPWRVEAFTVDRAYVQDDKHEGLPVVPFDELEINYPPAQIDLLIPLGYQHINSLRRQRFDEARARGYRFANYVSSRAGIWPDLKMGENCMVFEHANIDPFVTMGDNVIVRSGAHISHHCTLEDHVFIAAQASLGGNVLVGEQGFVGVGAVARDGLVLGPRSYIGTGAALLENTVADAVYLGNPARRVETLSKDVT